MSSIRAKIDADLKDALRSRDELRLSVLRMISAALHNKEIEKRSQTGLSDISEEELIGVLRAEAKQRKDAAAGFGLGGRVESANKELEEARIIEAYLPAELSDEEIEKILAEVTSGQDGVSMKDFGRVMSEAMRKVRGRASGERVSAALKKIIK